MTIIIPIVANVLAVILFVLLGKTKCFSKMKNIYKQLLIGVAFGVVAILASEFGLKMSGAKMNVRDSGPLSAGLLFGPISGVVAGVIGGGYRALSVLWGGGTYTALACSLSALLAGVVAATLRKLMFDDKRPSVLYAIGIAVVMEIFHMLMIFITNVSDVSRAFNFVRECTIPMTSLNALTLGLSTFAVFFFGEERKIAQRNQRHIAVIFQRLLVISILISFIVTSLFTGYLQTDMREQQIHNTFKSTMRGVIDDINAKAEQTMIEKVTDIKGEYDKDHSVPLSQLAQGVVEINVIDTDGIIIKSTEEEREGVFDMKSTEQSAEFMTLVNAEEGTTFVQSFRPMGLDGKTLRKFAGITLADGGFLQIGYDERQFHEVIDRFVVDFTKNRRVGTNGLVLVLDEGYRLVTDNEKSEQDLSSLGITPNEEMLAKTISSKVYTTNLIDPTTGQTAEHLYVFTFTEGYCVIATIPKDEAMLIRDASAYLSIFAQIVVFGVLFVTVYFLIKKLVIDNMYKINGTLAKISSGDLEQKVDAMGSEEFYTLSTEINTTVDTLKRYIKEAAERIDKELEYAKKIQLSVIPKDFPNKSEYEIYAQMISAKEVGGDFYDFYSLNQNQVAILVADVSGKGIPSAMFMMTAKAIIKELAERGLPLDEIFTLANEKLLSDESGMFVTCWMGILNVDSGELSYVNAGHNPPLVLKDGKFDYLRTRAGLVLAGMDGIKYKTSKIQLQKGDRIFLYTDGVTEATDKNLKLYGEQRLITFMQQNKDLSATELLTKLKEDIDAFVDGAPQFDDITMLVFDFKDENKKDGVQKVFSADTSVTREVIDFVEGQLDSHDSALKPKMQILIAIEEVFVNVANYAYDGNGGKVTIKIDFDESTRNMTFTVIDDGKEFNPLEKPDPDVTLSADDREIGGLGIFITKKTMDKILYENQNGQNVLTIIKKI